MPRRILVLSSRSDVCRDYNIILLLPSGNPSVRLEKAAEATETSDLTVRRLRPWGDEFSAEAGVWPLVVVIEQELAHDIAELLNRGDDEMVEAFGLKGLDEGLDVAVGFGATGRYALGLATDIREVVGEPCLEERVSVVDEVTEVEKLSAEAVGLVTGDLRHPLGIRIDGNASAPHFPGGKVLKEEDVGALQFAILLRHFVGAAVRHSPAAFRR